MLHHCCTLPAADRCTKTVTTPQLLCMVHTAHIKLHQVLAAAGMRRSCWHACIVVQLHTCSPAAAGGGKQLQCTSCKCTLGGICANAPCGVPAVLTLNKACSGAEESSLAAHPHSSTATRCPATTEEHSTHRLVQIHTPHSCLVSLAADRHVLSPACGSQRVAAVLAQQLLVMQRGSRCMQRHHRHHTAPAQLSGIQAA